jgi:hypothetical protein
MLSATAAPSIGVTMYLNRRTLEVRCVKHPPSSIKALLEYDAFTTLSSEGCAVCESGVRARAARGGPVSRAELAALPHDERMAVIGLLAGGRDRALAAAGVRIAQPLTEPRLRAPLVRKRSRLVAFMMRAARRLRPWHWFDHPEMQARIAKAEDDLANGRFTDTPASEYLERLRT